MQKIKFNIITTAIIFAVAFCIFFTVSPIVLADSSATDLSITLDPVISIRVMKNNVDTDNLTLNVDPTASGRFIKDDLSVVVSTSNDTGYTLTFANNDTDNSMHHADSSITTTIPSITTATDEANFPVNSWGYSLGDITSSAQQFSSIPLSTATTTIKTTTTPIAEDSTNVTFAAKVDTSIPAGVYSDTVVFTATTNYVPKNPLDALNSMQDMTASVCNAARIGDEATLTDSRDGKTYNIRKMEDGKCWMIQNLALGDTNTPVTLTSADSDVTSSFTIPTSAITNSVTDWSNVDSIHVYNNGDAWIESTSAGNNSIVHTDGSTPPSQSQYIGNYYNWYTATAGTGTSVMTTGNAPSSICPKGWRLPTGGSDSYFTSLTGALVDITTNTTNVPDKAFFMQNSPNFFILSGHQSNTVGTYQQGILGYWWSSTAFSGTNANWFYTTTNALYPASSYSKATGFSIRCVAATPFDSIEYMQDMTSAICSAASIGDQKVLWDNRDSKSYVIRKLKDGNCWMVQNLRLGGSSAITLTPANTNITSNFTLSATTNSFGTTNDAAGININRQNSTYQNAWVDDNNAIQTTGTPPSQTQYIGNYYNWYTATASSGTYAISTTGQNAAQSICPKGWRLPTGGDINTTTGNGEFQKLYNTYENADDFAVNTSAVLSGRWYDSSAHYQGSYGDWWSRTADNASLGYLLDFNNSSVYPKSNISKRYGFSVRCLAQ